MNNGESTATENQQRHGNADAPFSPTPALTTANPNQPHGNNVHDGPNTNPEHSERWFQHADWWIVILTALTVIVAGITLRVFYKQFKEMQIQSGLLNTQAKQAAKDAIESAKKVERQLEIADRQATAAQESVKAIQRQTRQDQRAWIKPTAGDIRFNVGKELISPISIENIGKTPAINLYLEVTVDLLNKSEVPQFLGEGENLREHPRNGLPVGVFLPTERFTFPAIAMRPLPNGAGEKLIMKQGMADELEVSRKTYIVVHGFVRYDDIFGSHHWVTFCRMGSTTDIPQDSSAGAADRICDAHNQVDDNQPRGKGPN